MSPSPTTDQVIIYWFPNVLWLSPSYIAYLSHLHLQLICVLQILFGQCFSSACTQMLLSLIMVAYLAGRASIPSHCLCFGLVNGVVYSLIYGNIIRISIKYHVDKPFFFRGIEFLFFLIL